MSDQVPKEELVRAYIEELRKLPLRAIAARFAILEERVTFLERALRHANP